MAFISEAARYTRDSGNVNNVSTNYLHSYPAGTLILLAVNAPVPNVWTAMSVVDSAGNVYAMAGGPRQDMPSNYQVAQFYCVLTNPVTTSTTLTATASDRNPPLWVILAAAFDDPASFDVHTANVGTSTAPSSGAASPTATDQLIFGTIAWTDGTGIVSLTPALNWTNLTKATASPTANGRSMAIGYRYVNVSAGRSYSGTLSSSQAWASLVTAFTLGGNPVAVYDRQYQIVIDATGSTNPVLTQNAGPSATINSTASPVFVITEPTVFTSAMSFTLTATDGGETATEPIVIDPRGTNSTGPLVWNGTDWV